VLAFLFFDRNGELLLLLKELLELPLGLDGSFHDILLASRVALGNGQSSWLRLVDVPDLEFSIVELVVYDVDVSSRCRSAVEALAPDSSLVELFPLGLLRLDKLLVFSQDVLREAVEGHLDDGMLANVVSVDPSRADAVSQSVEIELLLALGVPVHELNVADKGGEPQLEH